MEATCLQTARPLTQGKAPFGGQKGLLVKLNMRRGACVCACKTVKGGSSVHMCSPGSLVIVQCDGGFAVQTVDSCVQQCKHMQLDLLSAASLQQCSVGKHALLSPPPPQRCWDTAALSLKNSRFPHYNPHNGAQRFGAL